MICDSPTPARFKIDTRSSFMAQILHPTLSLCLSLEGEEKVKGRFHKNFRIASARLYSIWQSEAVTGSWYKIQMGCTRRRKHVVIRDPGEWKRNRSYLITSIRTVRGQLDT